MLNEISENLRNGFYTQNPVGANEDHARLAGEYSWLCGQAQEILKIKASKWNNIRQNSYTKSDKQADRIWEATDDGINEAGLKLRMKGAEKMLSALKSIMRNAENESHNTY